MITDTTGSSGSGVGDSGALPSGTKVGSEVWTWMTT